MIKKYHINFNQRKENRIKKLKLGFKDLYLTINSIFKNKNTKNQLSFAPHWNKIEKRKGLEKLIYTYIHLPHINKKSMIASISILFVLASFLFNFYVSIDNRQIGQAKEFVSVNKETIIYPEIKEKIVNEKEPVDTLVIEDKEPEIIFSGTGRLYFKNEGDLLVDYDNSLKINKNFNYELFPGQEDIEIVWDQLYTSDIETINAKRCLFYIYPYNSKELLSSGSSSIISSKCSYIFKASDQISNFSYTIQSIVIDQFGDKYENEKVLILTN